MQGSSSDILSQGFSLKLAVRWWPLCVLASFGLLGGEEARATGVGLGNLTVIADSASGDLAGSKIVWDDATFDVFGLSMVNLGTAAGVNPMSGSGSTGPQSGDPPSGQYSSVLQSATPGQLTLTSEGDFVCPDSPSTGCVFGAAIFPASFVGDVTSLVGFLVDGGPGTLPTTLGGEPLVYEIDGDLFCNTSIMPGFSVCDGRIFLNAFGSVNTPSGGTPGDPGDSVAVTVDTVFSDPDTGIQVPVTVNVIYDAVSQEGTTTVTTTSQAAGNISSEYAVEVEGYDAFYFDVETDAVVSGTTVVCGQYPDEDAFPGFVDPTTTVSECSLEILHRADGSDDFLPATLTADDPLCPFDPANTTCDNVCIDTVDDVICAGVEEGLSPFVIAIRLDTAPDCSGAVPSVASLWPPSHAFVDVDVLGVTDPDGDPVTITIDSIFQDEPVDGVGDGNTAPDGAGVGTGTAAVRAERSGGGNGRVYQVGFTADDGLGGMCSGEVVVAVPRNRGKKGAAVDDGALFDSTLMP